MRNVDQALAERGYEFKFEYGDYDYSWAITRVYSRDGRLFSLSASGCSCVGFDDMFDNVEEAIGDMHEVARLPALSELSPAYSSYDQSAEAIQSRYRYLGLH